MKLKVCFATFTFLLLISCNQTDKLPDKDDATRKNAKELPIDGLYIMSTKLQENLEKSFGVIGNDLYVRVKKEVIFYEDMGMWKNHPGITPGKVFIKDIKKITPTKYQGTYLVPKHGLINDTSLNVTILVDGNNLKTTVPPVGPFKISLTYYFTLEE
jgi:hypothetical protein